MTEPEKPEATEKRHMVIWQLEDWEKLEAAAALMNEREHLSLIPADIIRSGAIRRAEEILGHASAA
jgi:hypothetical protein